MREVQIAAGREDIRSTQHYTHPWMVETVERSISVLENHFWKDEKNERWEIRDFCRCGVRDLNPPY